MTPKSSSLGLLSKKNVRIGAILAVLVLTMGLVLTAAAAVVPSGSISPFVWAPDTDKWENGNPGGYTEGETAVMVVEITGESTKTYTTDICLQVQSLWSGTMYYGFVDFNPYNVTYQPTTFPDGSSTSDGLWDTSNTKIWGHNATIDGVSPATLGQGTCDPGYLGITVEFTALTDMAYITYGGVLASPGAPLPDGLIDPATLDTVVPGDRGAADVSGVFQSAIAPAAKTINFKGDLTIKLPGLDLVKTVTTEGGTCPGIDGLKVPVGAHVDYCFDITNNGNAALIDVKLVDELFGDVNIAYPAGGDLTVLLGGLTDEDGDLIEDDLASLGHATAYNISYGPVLVDTLNTAYATGSDLAYDDPSSVWVYVVEIDVEKKVSSDGDDYVDGPIDVTAGDDIYWQIVVTNTGTVTVTLTMTDTLEGVVLPDVCLGAPLELNPNGTAGDSYTCNIGPDPALIGSNTNDIEAEGCFADPLFGDQCDEATDNATYNATAEIIACKEEYGTGTALGNWEMNLSGPETGSSLTAGDTGCTSFTVSQAGSYDLSETEQVGWTRISPDPNNYAIEVSGSQASYGPYSFVNSGQSTVEACKVDSENVPIVGWLMSVNDEFGSTVDSGVTEATTGCVTFTLEQPGPYTLVEETIDGWTHVDAPTWSFTAESGGTYDHTFANYEHGDVTACKVDSEGLDVPEWLMTLNDEFGTTVDSGVTDGEGCVTFELTQPGPYTVTEEIRTGWTPLGPMSYDFVAASGLSYGPYEFENYEHGDVTACKVDSEGVPVPGWLMSVGGQSEVTGGDGCVIFLLEGPGTYTLVEETRDDWTHLDDPTYTFRAKSGGSDSHTFANYQHGDVTACKYDSEGLAVEGWVMSVTGLTDQSTGTDGCTTFILTDPGTYTVTEEIRTGWTPIGPTSYGFLAESGLSYGPYDFDNYEYGDVTACKYDSEGLAVEGWVMSVTGLTDQSTGPEGCTTFILTDPGTYTVTEEIRTGWTPIGPTSYGFLAESGLSYGPYDFDNYEYGDVTACKYDSEGLAVEGWEIGVTGVPSQTTGTDGCTTFILTDPGTYTVTEESRPGWTPIGPTSYGFLAESGLSYGPFDFDNYEYGDVTACKYDSEGLPVEGWVMSVTGLTDQSTGTDGCTTFILTDPGTYTVTEESRPGWTPIGPTSYGFLAESGLSYGPYDFDNYEYGDVTACKYDSEGLAVEGWVMSVTGLTDQSTGTDGCTTFILTDPGTYTVTEESRPGWTPIGPTSYGFLAESGLSYGPYDFENYEYGDVTACKYDSEGLAVEGWEIGVTGVPSQTTGTDGCTTFILTDPGTYTVTEESRPGWTPIGPTSYGFLAESGLSYGPYDFENYEYGDVEACKYDSEGLPVEGWVMSVTGLTDQSTGTDGCTTFILTDPGTYTVTEESRPGWTPIGPTSYGFLAESGLSYGPYDFENYEYGDVEACKYDSEGLPVEGWEIGVTGVPSQTTGTDGCTTFILTDPGTYTVTEESRPGWTPIGPTSYGFLAESGLSYGPYDFENYEYGDVEACKYDSEGLPVEGWVMSVTGLTDQSTGTDGCTTFILTDPGTYTVTEESRPGWTPIGPTSYGFLAESGESYGPYDFENYEYGDVEACKYDSEGLPVEGWEIGVTGVPSQTTGTDGCTTFILTDPGTYTVTEESRPGWTPIGPTSYGFLAESGLSYGPYDFDNYEYGDVEACKYDSEGLAVEGWEIGVTGVPSQTTGTDGCTTFILTDPGTYTVTEEIRTGWTPIGPTSYGFLAESGLSYGPYDFDNYEYGDVTACKYDSEGLPVEGWEIGVTGVPSQTTGTDGCTTFILTDPGTYTVTEESRPGWTPIGPTSYGFLAESGLSYGPYDFENYEYGDVTACKVDSEGVPVPGWLMSVDGQSERTGDDGCVTFPLEGPGTYTLVEETRDDWTHIDDEPSWMFRAKSGVSYKHTFVNYQHGEVTACKVDSEGIKVPGWGMTLYDPTGAEVATVSTDEGYGCVTFPLTEPGTYTVTEESRTGWTPLDESPDWSFTAKSGVDSYSHTFANYEHGKVTACKVDSEGLKVPGWGMTLSDPTGAEVAAVSTDEEYGCVTFDLTEPGTYTVTEESRTGWTPLDESPDWSFTAKSGGSDSHTFTNFQHATVTACKEDVNENRWDGWTINLNGPYPQLGVTGTKDPGCVEFEITMPGTYSLTEVFQAGWIQIQPVSGSFDFEVTSGYADTFTFVNAAPSVLIDKQISGDYNPETLEGSWHHSIEVVVGTPLYYQFVVTNDGDTPLENVKVTDPTLDDLLLEDEVHVFCTYETLAAGQSETCGPFGPTNALFTGKGEFNLNTATVGACYQGVCVDDEDTAEYTSRYWAFTPGFWKNHGPYAPSGHDAWQYTAYSSSDELCDIFNASDYVTCGILLDGLKLQGGAGEYGAAEILLRASVASLLDASFHEVSHGDIYGDGGIVYFPLYSTYEVCMTLSYGHDDAFCTITNVESLVNAALDPNGEESDKHRIRMLMLAAELDLYNNGFEWINWDEGAPLPQ